MAGANGIVGYMDTSGALGLLDETQKKAVGGLAFKAFAGGFILASLAGTSAAIVAGGIVYFLTRNMGKDKDNPKGKKKKNG